MKRLKRLPAIFAALALMLVAAVAGLTGMFGGSVANADTSSYSFYFESYSVTMDIQSDRSIHVSQDLTINYTGTRNTGFIQYIPVNGGEIVKDVKAYNVVDGKKQTVPYTVYDDRADDVPYICVDVGDTKIKSGIYSYRVEYDYLLTKAQEGKDKLYLNVIGVDRQAGCDIKNAEVTLILPDGYTDGECFVGTLYSDKSAEFTASRNQDGRTELHLTNVVLDYNEGVTFRLTFENGALSTYFDATPLWFSLIAVILIAIAVLLRMFCFNKHILTPVVNFEAPKKMTPLLMGKLIDNKVNNEDITSMIFYWADKGYLKINLDDKDDPTLIRLVRDLPSSCEDYEILMFSQLFNGRDAVKPSELRNQFYTTVGTVTAKVNARAKGLYDSKSVGVSLLFALLGGLLLGAVPLLIAMFRIHSSFLYYYAFLALVPTLILYGVTETMIYNRLKFSKNKKLLLGIGIFAICAVFTALYVLLVPSYLMGWVPKLILCALCCAEIILSAFLISRTKEYTTALNDIVGFRNFIQLAEKDKLEVMLEEDPQFYYHILPYAQVLGVSDIWEEKFKDITVQPPQWATSSTTENLINFYIVNALIRNSMIKMGANMVSRPSSSGGSGRGGFSGGGHVGGGHGGGGFRGR